MQAGEAKVSTISGPPTFPSPVLTGEEGPKRSLGGEGLYTGLGKTLTSHRFAVGPSSPLQGEGLEKTISASRHPCGCVFSPGTRSRLR